MDSKLHQSDEHTDEDENPRNNHVKQPWFASRAVLWSHDQSLDEMSISARIKVIIAPIIAHVVIAIRIVPPRSSGPATTIDGHC